MVTASKSIERYCPSDLLESGIDNCEGNKEEGKCKECWNRKVT